MAAALTLNFPSSGWSVCAKCKCWERSDVNYGYRKGAKVPKHAIMSLRSPDYAYRKLRDAESELPKKPDLVLKFGYNVQHLCLSGS